MTIPHQEERARFAAVMAARTSAKELIGLFDKLGDSEKFSLRAKPYCFADLIESCTQRVPASSLDALLEAMNWNWVGDSHYRLYDKGEARKRIGPLIRKVLEASRKDEVLERRMGRLRFSGAVASNEDAIELAREAGLSEQHQQQVREALARLAARPPEDIECPF